MSQSDKEFARSHAERYAEASISFGAYASDYADWYMENYWTDEGGIEDLPDHNRAWTIWLREAGHLT